MQVGFFGKADKVQELRMQERLTFPGNAEAAGPHDFKFPAYFAKQFQGVILGDTNTCW
jgi:hypothetical protein